MGHEIKETKGDSPGHSPRIKESARQKSSRFRRKVTFFFTIVVLVLGIVISSAFFSPAVSEVLTKVPVLSSFFASTPIEDIIGGELKDNDYKISAVGARYKPKKTIDITVKGSEKYYKSAKTSIKKMVSDILKSNGYGSYTIHIKHEPKHKKGEKRWFEDKIKEKLNADYGPASVRVNPKKKTIIINMRDSKHDELKVKKTVEKVARTSHYKGYTIQVIK
ncbi:hypothetical protein ACFO4N_15085 [Camelliibacillus cellulosilyticus]|uniref:Stage III sporulation protein AH n=1 Tax=Camelliibacillus cellulosilyticus TaxID=2174486 RepID=A0ABV9GTJ9_9BACL